MGLVLAMSIQNMTLTDAAMGARDDYNKATKPDTGVDQTNGDAGYLSCVNPNSGQVAEKQEIED